MTSPRTSTAHADPSDEQNHHIPRFALYLGAAGLAPFLTGALVAAFGGPTLQSVAQPYLVGYGIAILSFMGGVHWGLAMGWATKSPSDSAPQQFAISVIPALAAWMTLFLPVGLQLAWLAICFGVLLIVDVKLTRLGRAPDWYPSLRWPLSLVVISCLCITALTVGLSSS